MRKLGLEQAIKRLSLLGKAERATNDLGARDTCNLNAYASWASLVLVLRLRIGTQSPLDEVTARDGRVSGVEHGNRATKRNGEEFVNVGADAVIN